MIHKQLPVPSDSAWDRKSIRKYIPIWIKRIYDGIKNILIWIPIIYKDRHWDSDFIFEILKFKLIQQRKELINANRHEGVEKINRDITLCLNLIEKILNDHYALEYCKYYKSDYEFIKLDDQPEYSKLKITPIWNKFDEYFAKYPLSVKKLLELDSESFKNKHLFAMNLADYNQEKCQKLLFKILNNEIQYWWD